MQAELDAQRQQTAAAEARLVEELARLEASAAASQKLTAERDQLGAEGVAQSQLDAANSRRRRARRATASVEAVDDAAELRPRQASWRRSWRLPRRRLRARRACSCRSPA